MAVVPGAEPALMDRAFRIGVTVIVVPIVAYAWCRGAALVAKEKLRGLIR